MSAGLSMKMSEIAENYVPFIYPLAGNTKGKFGTFLYDFFLLLFFLSP